MREFDQWVGYITDELMTAIRCSGMEINDCPTAVELIEHCTKTSVTGPLVPITGHQADAVRLEYVKRMFDLSQGAVRIRKRNCGEETESFGIVFDELRRVVIAFARQFPRRLCIPEPDTGACD